LETKEHTRRRRTLRCSLCGLEITEGEDYWYCNGSSVCGACLPVFARAEELLSAGLDVPQVTRIAMRLREQGLAIDPAVYTVETLERELLALRRGETGC